MLTAYRVRIGLFRHISLITEDINEKTYLLNHFKR